MNKFTLYTSNRLEMLAKALSDVIAEKPLSDPLAKEVVIVHGSGMERWVFMQLAGYTGICANMGFYFPNSFIDQMFHKLIPDVSLNINEPTPFDPAVMQWQIMKLLPECVNRPGFEPLKQYLGDQGDCLKLYQLAERIAYAFDQYVLFRPEMIFGWEKGDDSQWQAELWRELAKGREKLHRAGLFRTFLNMAENAFFLPKDFPDRISIFGISALPRFHMDVFASFSRFSQVNLFLMNPCMEYWGDIKSEKEAMRVSKKAEKKGIKKDDLLLEKGNSLLASMGSLGRDYFDLVNEYDIQGNTLFEDPGDETLLCSIQSDILNLVERGESEADRKEISGTDDSIRIHVCHSPMRELEVLHDHLLDIFEKYQDITPSDILVMAPDIETYAPYIQAVFDRPFDDPLHIPFSIADRSVKHESRIIETFLDIMDMEESRFEVSKVSGILESDTVCRKFNLSEKDRALISGWINDTRIRWGIDGKNKVLYDLPDTDDNTWISGIHRLLLGYALPGQDENLFSNILPYDHMEGADTETLGNFIEFFQSIVDFSQKLEKNLSLSEWVEVINDILDTFFVSEESGLSAGSGTDETAEKEIHAIRRACEFLLKLPEDHIAGFKGKIDARTVRYYLTKYFENRGFGFGFLTGGVTFCAMLPMRSIPFKIICVIGLNHDAFPRQSIQSGFDLIAANPRPGDRSRRMDDRYLFLETILSARQILYISYVGRSIKDNTPIPPSVLVSELLDTINQQFEIKEKNIIGHLTVNHRLQAFSPACFSDSDDTFFSYSKDYFEASATLTDEKKAGHPFVKAGLSKPSDEWKEIHIDDLIGFYSHPIKYLLNKRLGIFYGIEDEAVQDEEPFKIDGLERYVLHQELLKKHLNNADPDDVFNVVKSAHMLPHANIGRVAFNSLWDEVKKFAEKTRQYIESLVLSPIDVDIDIGGFGLTGRLDSIYPSGLVQYRMAKIKPKDLIRSWILHLALNLVRPENYPQNSILIGLNDKNLWEAWEFPSTENSRDILENLVRNYWQGLLQPFVFFHDTSFEYAVQLIEKNKTPGEALFSAVRKWEGNDFSVGEKDDLYNQRCFGYVDPMGKKFEENAVEFWQPIIKERRKAQGVREKG